MAIQVFGAPAAVVMLNRAFADTSPGNLIYQNQVAAATANQVAFANDFGAGYASLSNAALAELVLGNLGLLPNDALKTALADYYAANGAANRGFVTLQLCNILASKEGDATYGAAAVAWNNEVAAAYNYSANEANTSSSGSSTAAPASFTTSAGETLNGTSGDDTFTGGTFNANATVNSGDVVNGGAGTDTVRINAEGAAAALELNGVEDLEVRLLSSQSLNAALWSGVQTVEVLPTSVSGQTLTLTNAKVATEYVLGAVGSLDVTFSASGAAKVELTGYGTGGDSIAVSLRNAGDVEIDNVGVNDIDTLNATAKTIDIDGEGTLAVSAITTVVSAIDTTGFTSGSVSVGVDVASVLSYSGGAANDTLTLRDGLTSADVLRGGDGTDTIVAAIGAGSLDNVTGFEVGTFSAAGVAFNQNLSGYTTVTFSGDSNVAFTASSLAGATVNLRMNSADGVTLGYATGDATINVNRSAVVSFGVINISGADAVDFNVLNSTADSTISTLGATGATSVRVDLTGSSDVVISELRARNAESLALTVDGADNNSLTISDSRLSNLTSVEIVVDASAATLDLDALAISGQDLTYTVAMSGDRADVDVGGITNAAGSNVTLSVNVGRGGFFGSATNFNAAVTDGDLSLTVVAGNSATFSGGDFIVTGSGSTTVSLTAGVSGNIAIDAVRGIEDVALTIDGGQDSRIDVGATTGRTIADLSITAGSSAQVTIGAIGVSGSIDSVTIAGAGGVQIAALGASATIGDISVTTGSATFGTVSARSIGDINLNAGSYASGTFNASSIGDITISGSGANVVLASAINGVGDITIAGYSNITVDLGNASGVGDITTVGNVSAATINLSAVTTSTNVTLGTGTNTVFLSDAGDELVLAAGTGTDTLRFGLNSIATTTGGASVTNFEWATAALDVLLFATAAFDLGLGSVVSHIDNPAGALDVVNLSAATTITVASAASDEATDVVVLTTARAFTSVADMMSGLALLVTAGSNQSAIAAGDLLVVWYNSTEGRTELSLVNTTAATDFLTSAINGGSAYQLAFFDGDTSIITTRSGDSFATVFSAE